MVSQLDYIYNIVLFFATYLVPMTAMVCCYASMARHLWGSRSIGELTTCQQECIRSKRKVVRMFLVVVSVFGTCWLPYHSYFIYAYHKKDFVYSKYVQHLYLSFYWLVVANAMLNPLIYYCMNTRLREYFRQIVCCLKKEVVQPNKRFIHSCARRKASTALYFGDRQMSFCGRSRGEWSSHHSTATEKLRASETTVSVGSDPVIYKTQTLTYSRNSIRSCFNTETSQL